MYFVLSSRLQAELQHLVDYCTAPDLEHIFIHSSAFWPEYVGKKECEVCMVIQRPDGHLLTFTKTFYPDGVYRLFTGGVEPGEHIIDALWREVYEETGLEVKLERLLSVIAYHAEDDLGQEMIPTRFMTFAFLLKEIGGILGVNDPGENLAAYKEIKPAQLSELAEQLEQLPDEYSSELQTSWQAWGKLRAVVHRLVAEKLEH